MSNVKLKTNMSNYDEMLRLLQFKAESEKERYGRVTLATKLQLSKIGSAITEKKETSRYYPFGFLPGGILVEDTLGKATEEDLSYQTPKSLEETDIDYWIPEKFQKRIPGAEKWEGQRIELPKWSWPKFPDITGGITKAILIIVAVIGGIYILGKFLSGRK